MQKGERPFKFLAWLILREFYGTVTMKSEAGEVTHAGVATQRMWQYKDLPDKTRAPYE